MANTKELRIKFYISICNSVIVIGCEVKYFKCIILNHSKRQKFFDEFDTWSLDRNIFNETNFETIKNLNLIDVKKVSIIEKILGIEDEVKDDKQIIETCTSC